MTNVEKAADDFYGHICERIDAIYDLSKCKTRKDLAQLIDGEVIELMKLQQFTNDGLRDACYEGLRKDGIEFPKILWAQYVGTKIKVPYYRSIREEVPQEQLANSKPSVVEHKAMQQGTAGKANTSKGSHPGTVVTIGVGAGLTVTNTVQVIRAGIAETAISPISIALIALGICITAAGVVTFVASGDKSTRQARPEARPVATLGASAQQSDKEEEDHVADILSKQSDRCKEYAKEWCKNVLDIVRLGVEQTRAEE